MQILEWKEIETLVAEIEKEKEEEAEKKKQKKSSWSLFASSRPGVYIFFPQKGGPILFIFNI